MASDKMLSWLRSTIEGDKAAASEAAAPRKGRYTLLDPDGNRQFDHTPRPYNGEWRLSKSGDAVAPCCPEADAVVSGSCGCCCPTSQGQEVDLVHIAIHDPRDTIARCEAELALLDKVDEAGRGLEQALADQDRMDTALFTAALGAFMLAAKSLAKGRRHRPGFNPEWVSG